jgi:two-component system, cell cycle sensor histidine kinase and response regulator CckA
LGISEDITERKRAEENLARLNQQNELILTSTAEGIMGLDLQGNHTFVNPAAAKMLGYNTEELIGRNSHDIWHHTRLDGSPYPLEECAINNVYQDGKVCHLSTEVFWRKDGTSFPVEYTSTPIYEQDRLTGAVVTFTDITARKEEELMKMQRLDSLGVLAGGIAHDFNNILMGILGNISYAKHNIKPDDKSFKVLDDAEKASFQAKALTKQLLTFAKGGEPVKTVKVISDLVKETVLFALHGSKVKCSFKISPELLVAEVDSGQMGQVMSNLVINAMQAMPEGGNITVKVENREIAEGSGLPLTSGRYVRIEIKDTGVGISPEHLGKVFDPYFTTKQAGNGLGLATCYSIIKRHEGFIEAESEVGKGSSFIFYIPAYTGKVDVTLLSRSTEIKKGKGHILLMDDEEIICDVVTKMLEGLGYTVEFAVNSDQAEEKYRKTWGTKKAFDAVILDLTIPGGKGGKEAIEGLRKINPDIKAVVSSGYSKDPILSKYKEYGFSAVLPKPFNLERLSEVLHRLLTQDRT